MNDTVNARVDNVARCSHSFAVLLVPSDGSVLVGPTLATFPTVAQSQAYADDTNARMLDTSKMAWVAYLGPTV